MVFRYVTGNLVQFTITYYVTTAATNPTASGCLAMENARMIITSSLMNVARSCPVRWYYGTTKYRPDDDRNPRLLPPRLSNRAASDPSEAKNSKLQSFCSRFVSAEATSKHVFLERPSSGASFVTLVRFDSRGKLNARTPPEHRFPERARHDARCLEPTSSYVTGNPGQFTITHYQRTRTHQVPA